MGRFRYLYNNGVFISVFLVQYQECNLGPDEPPRKRHDVLRRQRPGAVNLKYLIPHVEEPRFCLKFGLSGRLMSRSVVAYSPSRLTPSPANACVGRCTDKT